MNAVILGSTGLVGGELLKLLLDDSKVEKITALNRKAGPSSGQLQIVQVNFNDLKENEATFKAHVCFCCLGTTMKKAGSKEAFKKVDYEYPLQAAKIFKEQSPGGHFIVITAMGANADSSLFYNKVKGELEEGLKGLGLHRLSICRPSLILGERKESRPAEAAGTYLLSHLSFITNIFLSGPLKKYRAISAKVIAQALLKISLQKEGAALSAYSSEQLSSLGNQRAT